MWVTSYEFRVQGQGLRFFDQLNPLECLPLLFVQREGGWGDELASLRELLNILDPLDYRLRFVFSEGHPVPIDGRIGIVDDWYPEDGISLEFG